MLFSACGQSVEISAEEVCDAVVGCTPSVDRAECVTSTEPQLRRAEEAGCASEADAANRCTLDELDTDCEADLAVVCEGPYAAYTECVGDSGADTDFGCDDSDDPTNRLCTQYTNNPNDPVATCDALGAEPVDECPSAGVVATCTIVSGSTTTELSYYDPLPTGLTVDTLEGICTGQGGTFTIM